MKEDEFENIKQTIEKNMNLNIKEINKIYQASIDGKDLLIFIKNVMGLKIH